MTKTNEAFFRFFLRLAGHPPRFVVQLDPIDEQIERLAYQLQKLKTSHGRSRKRVPRLPEP